MPSSSFPFLLLAETRQPQATPRAMHTCDPENSMMKLATDNVAGGDHGGHGFARPSVVVRWFRTASSVHRASRRMKPGSQLEYGLWMTGRGFTP